jgi:hypothetical protein
MEGKQQELHLFDAKSTSQANNTAITTNCTANTTPINFDEPPKE